MTKEALTQLAEIEAITQPEPELTPSAPQTAPERSRRAESGYTTTTFKSWHPGRQRKPKPVPAPVDDDDDSDAIADDGSDFELGRLPQPALYPAHVGATVQGLPNPNGEPEVVEAQAGLDRLTDQRVALTAEITALETALGLKPGASAKDVEKLAVQLLAAGQSDADIEKLELLRTRVRRLTGAEGIAGTRLRDVRELVVRRLSAEASQREFVPACRAKALALLALIKCDREERDASDRLRAGGFHAPQGTFFSDLLDHWNNHVVCQLVHGGHLRREEVLEVMPHLSGI